MDFGTIIYIVIIIIVVIANIYKGIKKAAEEQRQRREQNAHPPTTIEQRPQTDTIPDPCQEPRSTPAPQRRTNTNQPSPSRTQPAPRKKTIEEILEEMTRQYEEPTPPKVEKLDSPYSNIDRPYSKIDKLSEVVGKGYKFDESTATRSLSAKSYTNILEEDDTLDDRSSVHSQPFNPREAVKYATLLERKYQ